MKTLKKLWAPFALIFGAVLVLCLLTAGILFGQTAPGLNIAIIPSNQVSLTITNGTSNGLYQIYFTQFLEDIPDSWTLFTNGTTGQTNFIASMEDFERGYFKAVNNTNFLPPAITVIIQSPANGSIIQ
jgi:hypothetical protein